MTACLMVHLREMRAMKVPTKGTPAINQPLQNRSAGPPMKGRSAADSQSHNLGEGIGVEGIFDEVVRVVTARQDDHVENVPRLIEGEHHHHYHVAAYEDDVKDRLDSELLACHDRGCVADVERGELHSPQGHTREFWGLHNLRSCSVRLWPFLQHMSMCKLGSSGIKGRIGRLLNCVLWHGCDRVGLSKPSHDSSHQHRGWRDRCWIES